MHTFYLCIITFFSAFFITYLNVNNSIKFHNYFFLIYRSALLITYCTIYGLIGVGLFFVLKKQVIAIESSSIRIGTDYLAAIAIGISTKGISDINLFNIKQGGEIIPIGFRTISRQIDSFFDTKFDSICYKRIVVFTQQFESKYLLTNIAIFRTRIIHELSSHPSREKVAAFTEVLNNAGSTKEILDAILREFGKSTFLTLCGKIPAVLP